MKDEPLLLVAPEPLTPPSKLPEHEETPNANVIVVEVEVVDTIVEVEVVVTVVELVNVERSVRVEVVVVVTVAELVNVVRSVRVEVLVEVAVSCIVANWVEV
jgi:hypothetical protein